MVLHHARAVSKGPGIDVNIGIINEGDFTNECVTVFQSGWYYAMVGLPEGR